MGHEGNGVFSKIESGQNINAGTRNEYRFESTRLAPRRPYVTCPGSGPRMMAIQGGLSAVETSRRVEPVLSGSNHDFFATRRASTRHPGLRRLFEDVSERCFQSHAPLLFIAVHLQ